jgi:hypothetical protein
MGNLEAVERQVEHLSETVGNGYGNQFQGGWISTDGNWGSIVTGTTEPTMQQRLSALRDSRNLIVREVATTPGSLVAGDSVQTAIQKLNTRSISVGVVPIGTVTMWSGTFNRNDWTRSDNVGNGWAICNGQTITNVSIGVTGRATPDLRGRFVVGVNNTNTDSTTDGGRTFYSPGNTGGAIDRTVNFPSHAHTFGITSGNGNHTTASYTRISTVGGLTTGTVTTSSNGSGSQILDIRPHYMALMYIIKVF